MNPPPNNDDSLDELLASTPVKPPADFSERVLARLNGEPEVPSEAAFEHELDALLESREVVPGEGFANRALAAAMAGDREDDTVIGLPSWVVAMGGIAALLILGMVSFIALFDFAAKQSPGPSVAAQDVQSADPSRAVATGAELMEPSTAPAQVPVGAAPELSDAAALEVVEFESVLTMDDALEEAHLVADAETLSALQAFLN